MNDRARLKDVEYVLHGEKGPGVTGDIAYAVYVAALLGGTYGFTVARAVFATSGPIWVREHLLTPAAAVVAAALFVALLLAARWAGSRRGPVVPPLSWTDVVVTSEIDRARSVRRWWTYVFVGGIAGGTILGAILGGGVWASRSGGWTWLPGAMATGALAGWVLMRVWLDGQVAAGGSGPMTLKRLAPRVAAPLRLLRLDDLRVHGARSTHMGGGVLAGDLRAVRLELAAPVTRGRTLRLRSSGPWATVVRRDILGLRRVPGAFWTGAVLSVVGAAGVAWSLTDPLVPWILTGGAIAACYLGMGAWSEGLRLVGDNAGTPPLLGLRFRTEAPAHLVVPTVLFAITSLTMSAVVLLTRNGPVPLDTPQTIAVPAWCLIIAALLAGTPLLAAFRGLPAMNAFLPEQGPMLMASWYAVPVAVSILSGTLIVSRATRSDIPALGLAIALATVAGVVAWGLHRVKVLEEAHRI